MNDDLTTHVGPSWRDMNASANGSTQRVWVQLSPVRGDEILVRVTALSDFRRHTFMATCVDLTGKTLSLLGDAHNASAPAKYRVST